MELDDGSSQTASALASGLCAVEAVALGAGVTCQLATNGARAALQEASDGAYPDVLLMQRCQSQALLWLQVCSVVLPSVQLTRYWGVALWIGDRHAGEDEGIVNGPKSKRISAKLLLVPHP
jgi:hypothetical protein